jgi:hypothetical protein
MTGPTYPIARSVAAKVQPHFARHLAAARAAGESDLAPEPDAQASEDMISTAFWASLRREEDYSPIISLAFLPPEEAVRPLTFERRLPLAPDSLARLAPAVERPGIHLGVWRENGELYVWGTTHNVPMFGFVLEVIAPGLLVIKHRRGEEYGKFVNVAVIESDQIKILDQNARNLADCPALVTSLLGFELRDDPTSSINVLVELAVSMRAHGRGGTLLVVPRDREAWRESMVRPIPYPVSPAFTKLADLMREDLSAREDHGWKEGLRLAVDEIAGLTAVDGATVITDEYELLAFGAKIARRDGNPRVERAIVTEPIEGAVTVIADPAQLGGTRHLSAAQFVQDQRDAAALVASQDGRFTVFAWSPCEEMVHGHRVETLLL